MLTPGWYSMKSSRWCAAPNFSSISQLRNTPSSPFSTFCRSPTRAESGWRRSGPAGSRAGSPDPSGGADAGTACVLREERVALGARAASAVARAICSQRTGVAPDGAPAVRRAHLDGAVVAGAEQVRLVADRPPRPGRSGCRSPPRRSARADAARRPAASCATLSPVCTEPSRGPIRSRLHVALAVAREDRMRREADLVELAEIVHLD